MIISITYPGVGILQVISLATSMYGHPATVNKSHPSAKWVLHVGTPNALRDNAIVLR